MFSILVFILQLAMLITTFITIPLLFIIRLITIIKNKIDKNEALLILLLPFSIGYYLILEKEKQSKLYNIVLIVLTIIAVIGILFTLFQRLLNSL